MQLNEPVTVIRGRLTDDPKLAFLNDGTAVCNVSVASNPRYKNKAGEWVDGTAVFTEVTIWRAMAENLADSDLSKGKVVTVVGRRKRRTWEDPDTRQPRWAEYVEADDVSVSLVNQRVRLVGKVTRPDAPSPESSTAANSAPSSAPDSPREPDPWETGGDAGAGAGWSDDPPF
jgi:single-strand DNA-binding protein